MKNKLFTIPAGKPFARTLAQWVLEKFGEEPHQLARVLLLLPSRRACLSQREAFLQVTGGKPLLLPRMQPLGDVDEDMLLSAPLPTGFEQDPPAAAFEYKRLFILAQLTERFSGGNIAGQGRMDNTLKLAGELATLFDELEREQVSLEGLQKLVPDRFAKHWQETTRFLEILSEHWPKLAAEEGLLGPEYYRSQRLSALAYYWKETPPETPVIAAGTTGSVPATAHLLKSIVAAPQGYIVLPGLDTQADNEYFFSLTESHPQWGLRHLLAELECSRESVVTIGEAEGERSHLLSEVMRPGETGTWRRDAINIERAVSGLRRVDAASSREEAVIVALMLREALEEKGRTAALITHDRTLARQVAAILERFGITIDDSAGCALMQAPVAGFLRLLLEVADSNASPAPLLGLLKHPLTHLGMERIACLEAARTIEIAVLRGVRMHHGLAGLRLALNRSKHPAKDAELLLQRLEQMLAPLTAIFEQGNKAISLKSLVKAHLECGEALAGEELWEGQDGHMLAAILADVRSAAEYASPLSPTAYPAVFDTLIAGKVLRPEYGVHPRLKILSPIEARMQSFDRIILGGLNEGSWPPEFSGDAWFNRAMRTALGLPAPERSIGQAAHDFVMLAASPEVFLTRALRSGGVPTTPCRWLVKLETMLKAFDGSPTLIDTRWNQWARALDEAAVATPVAAPAPTPPLAARPRQMSVTKIAAWLADPYAIYASEILGLTPLAPLDADPGGADFGSAVHDALERFVKAYPHALPANAYDALLQCGQQAFAELFHLASARTLWWPRFTRIAHYVIEQEQERRGAIVKITGEVEGTIRLGDFLLTGRADRIEENKDGSLAIIDYKTGALPAQREIEDGSANQLALLGLIASEGDSAVRGRVGALEYWQLRGAVKLGAIKSLDKKDAVEYIREAKEGLLALIRIYNDPTYPYRAVPARSRAGRYQPYDHLARVKEWG